MQRYPNLTTIRIGWHVSTLVWDTYDGYDGNEFASRSLSDVVQSYKLNGLLELKRVQKITLSCWDRWFEVDNSIEEPLKTLFDMRDWLKREYEEREKTLQVVTLLRGVGTLWLVGPENRGGRRPG